MSFDTANRLSTDRHGFMQTIFMSKGATRHFQSLQRLARASEYAALGQREAAILASVVMNLYMLCLNDCCPE
ncbi:hypothetical protein CEXT_697031 [Caerostris extrusa]|uniref:Uncharacterized protein n=1 Tax=Caerostris extrusa TaxID=172846 RepID=A0AAV4Y9X6_CAEEX|nr:hypothetical protein CEXT_697031 [Caerostris extrusa]